MEAELPACVKLIWQPAEEGGGGAERLVEEGVLDGTLGPKVDAIFGLHGWPGLPVGVVLNLRGCRSNDCRIASLRHAQQLRRHPA